MSPHRAVISSFVQQAALKWLFLTHICFCDTSWDAIASMGLWWQSCWRSGHCPLSSCPILETNLSEDAYLFQVFLGTIQKTVLIQCFSLRYRMVIISMIIVGANFVGRVESFPIIWFLQELLCCTDSIQIISMPRTNLKWRMWTTTLQLNPVGKRQPVTCTSCYELGRSLCQGGRSARVTDNFYCA